MIARRVIVTGASRGIGRAIASRFAREGASVVITATDGSNAERAAIDISRAEHGEVVGLELDLSREESIGRFAQWLTESEEIDALVNNAGIARRNLLSEITRDEWDSVFAVNVTGTVLVTQAVVRHMSTIDPVIVNVASQAGKRGEAYLSHYASSKAAQINITKSLALELAPRIRVNAVCPGFVETDMILLHYQEQARLRGINPEQVRKEMLTRIPLGRMQTPDSIADVVYFLASDSARDMTGQAINVTGGMVME